MSNIHAGLQATNLGVYPRGIWALCSRWELAGFETAKVNRSQRSNQGGQAGGGFDSQGNSNPGTQSASQDDPWGIPATSNATAGGWGNGPEAEPPF